MGGRRRINAIRRKILGEWLRILLGLLVFSLGAHLTIFANIGLAPWDCLGMGLSYHCPLNYGLSMTLIAIIVLIIDLFMKERIGYGTIIDALVTGNFIQMFNSLNPLSMDHSTAAGVGIMLIGFVFMAIGIAIYMKGGQCCGPRDAMLVGLGKKMRKLPIGIVQILLWAVVLLGGWLLGGPVGIGTVISAFGAGFVTQIIYSAIGFEPRDIRHRDVVETTRLLAGHKAK